MKNHIWSTLSRAAVIGPTGGRLVPNAKPSSGRLAAALYSGVALTVRRASPRWTTSTAGSAALQPSFWAPAHVCDAICLRSASGSPLRPSTARMRSPACRTPAAGVPLVVCSIRLVGLASRGSPIVAQ